MTVEKMLATVCLCLAVFFARAQNRAADYDAKWKTVDSLDKAGLPESALTVINRIYALARQEHRDGQEIKALIYRIAESQQKRENDDTASIAELEKAAVGAAQPSRSVLQSLLAGLYRNYFQLNRYKLYNRTATGNFLKTDIATWGIDDFHRRINGLYLASLQDEKLLKQVRVADYEPILFKGNMRYLRPTLFDLLAHEALDYFKSSETDVNQPANVFVIDDDAVFADAPVFADHTFQAADTSSAHYTALLLYQRLIRQHLADPRPDALIDVDIDRLGFARNYAVPEDKDEQYDRALVRITDRYGRLPAAAQAWYLQAQEYVTAAGQGWNGRDTTFHNGMVVARAVCAKVLTEEDSSEGKTNCQILLDDILRKKLNIQMEEFNLPGKPFRSLVTWANVNRIYLRLVRTDSLREIIPAGMGEAYWRQRLSLPVYRSFVQDLPATADYLTHSAEIPIGSLPPGAYTLLSSTDSGWDRERGVTTAQEFHVSSIAYICEGRDYFVVNRETGQPLNGATAKVWERVYTSGNHSWQLTGGEVYHTDAQGHFRLRSRKTNDGYGASFLEISIPGDDLFLSDINIPYWVGQDERGAKEEDKEKYEMENGQVYFFTDRSIYRPGQTVYFKGIVVTKDVDTRLPKIWAGRETTVVLYNTNNEQLDSLKLATDEFGAYHGSFHLPEHQLNGNFSIADLSPYSKHYFYVEEYKRPGFSVAFDRLKGTYRVGDSISVKGSAQAYAGNSLDGAAVKYRIIREATYSRFRFFGGWLRPQNSQEIAHGEIKTDASGIFRLVFVALPDRSMAPASSPRFHYRVEADVTDINGETRSGTADVVAGYTALDLAIWLSGERPFTVDKLKYLQVNATNLSGEPVPSKVHVAAYPLRAPNRLIRERQWTAPDLSVMSESAFLDSFPHDQYREELKKENWPRGQMAWEATDSTGDRRIPLRLSPGWWVIEATVTDAFGQVVKDEQYVELQDETQRPVSPQYLWGSGAEAETLAVPGAKAVVETGSSAANVFVFRKIERPGDSRPALGRRVPGSGATDSAGEYSSFVLTNGKNSREWTVTEADRGGFGVSDAFVKDNRLYMHQSMVRVPWTNKQLQIRYTAYRDKTEPGNGEKWAVTIGGDKGAQASAQILTAMYDASLDQFHPQNWSAPNLFPELGQAFGWGGGENFQVCWSRDRGWFGPGLPVYDKRYDQLLWVGGPVISSDRYVHRVSHKFPLPEAAVDFKGNVMAQGQRKTDVSVNGRRYNAVGYRDVVMSDTVEYHMKLPGEADEEQEATAPVPVRIRTNFNETAFFFPDLRTDSGGNVSFSFTMPEALTQWKWMTLAHTRDLAFGYSEKTIVTQKQLMVQPNIPRFLREGDKINLSVKVVNLTDSEMTGQMGLALTDPTTGETADGWFVNRQPNQYFTVAAHGSAVVEFPLDIPFQYNRPLSYRIVAQAGAFSDGEEAVLPVVSNRMLVTETLPLNMAGDGTRSFRFDKLLQSGTSETLSNHALTVEFTANPAWYAVQALPYLMEFPYECAEQVFDRLYANALASKIVNSSPRIAQVLARWRVADTAALLSNLEKNSELKSVLLEETPWVLQGKTESQQKKNIALLFDTTRISGELESAMGRLKELQAPDGGFAWFKGGPDDRFVTQYILTGIGHLQRFQALPAALAEKIKAMVTAALPFVDQQIRMDYERELKMEKGAGAVASGSAGGGMRRISAIAIQYLYMRSMFNDYGIPGDIFPAVFYYRKLARQEWVTESKYMQGMIALALFRTGDQQTGRNIIASLRQTAIHSEDLGMYWKGMEGGYYWYQAPIETESLLIEAFREISSDTGVDRELKTWLLRQKQTHSWATTKATADAVYALLLGGQDWLTAERSIGIRLGDKVVDWGPGIAGAPAGEAGTGYYKKIFDAPFINPSMGDVTVTMRTRGKTGSRPGGSATSGSPAWGAVYWQYFDQLDRITPTGSGAVNGGVASGGRAASGGGAALRLVKRVFVQRNTDWGPVLDTIPDGGSLKVGDRVVVRIELRADRDLEYVHLKDMRGACLEPVNVLSGYKWQGGLGYYETTKDASTEFFFPEVGKGTYVFEYTLVVGQTGEFSNGISSVECMYAPEFAFHTEGIRINVEGGQ